MANLQLQDILTTVRYLLDEQSSSGRYADAELTNYINMATIQTMVRVEWPEASWSLTSDGITKEYALPEMYALLRVYVAGQICVPTTIATLQGDQIGVSDQSTTAYGPQWLAAAFTGYPVAQGLSASSTGSLPFFLGQRPQFTTDRGGILTLVPPPTAGMTVAIDGYPAPAALVNLTDETFFPQLFKEAIAYKTMTYAYFAEDTAEANSSMQLAEQRFEQQVNQVLIPFKTGFNRNLPTPHLLMPHRTLFRGPGRGPTGAGSRFGA